MVGRPLTTDPVRCPLPDRQSVRCGDVGNAVLSHFLSSCSPESRWSLIKLSRFLLPIRLPAVPTQSTQSIYPPTQPCRQPACPAVFTRCREISMHRWGRSNRRRRVVVGVFLECSVRPGSTSAQTCSRQSSTDSFPVPEDSPRWRLRLKRRQRALSFAVDEQEMSSYCRDQLSLVSAVQSLLIVESL